MAKKTHIAKACDKWLGSRIQNTLSVGDIWDAGWRAGVEYSNGGKFTPEHIKTIIHLLRNSERPQSHAKLMDDAASALEGGLT